MVWTAAWSGTPFLTYVSPKLVKVCPHTNRLSDRSPHTKRMSETEGFQTLKATHRDGNGNGDGDRKCYTGRHAVSRAILGLS
eukprot:83190-Rhodomonas_salina.2